MLDSSRDLFQVGLFLDEAAHSLQQPIGKQLMADRLEVMPIFKKMFVLHPFHSHMRDIAILAFDCVVLLYGFAQAWTSGLKRHRGHGRIYADGLHV